MLTRKTQYAWMALGGMICLFGLVLACKLRDGNKAIAQADKPSSGGYAGYGPSPSTGLPTSEEKVKSKRDEKPLSAPPPKMAEPEMLLPPTRLNSKPKNDPLLGSPPKPAVTLEKPLSVPDPKPSTPAKSTLPLSSGPSLPVTFAPNTPSPKEEKKSTPMPKPAPFGGPAPVPPPAATVKAPLPTPPPAPMTPPSPPPSTAEKKPAGSSLDSLRSLMKKAASDNGGEMKLTPAAYAPVAATPPSSPSTGEHDSGKSQPGEPPLAPAPGPVQLYHVHGSETLREIARRTLGSSERCGDLHKLNPSLNPDSPLRPGITVRLPADACVQNDDVEPIKPLPALHPKPAAPKAKVLPLTGTYQCSLDEKGRLTLPRALRDQLDASETVLLSPGPDKCLWLTNQAHLERLAERLEHSQANETDVRVFKRLYFAQTEKLAVNSEGRVTVPERLSQFADLRQEVVLVGIDDHFEVWDAARWRHYVQHRNGGHAAASAETE
jgi:MraZ protein